ncbi:MAG: hypothetical protein IPJ74_10770 [Saprospiraceae bacterium]|nr:hypothetical protein [Saprospiraceae bacterium]
MPSTRVGLENIQHRYAFFSDDEVKIIESDALFSVQLPLIPASTAAPVAL